MNPVFKKPPLSVKDLTPLDKLAEHLAPLVGNSFVLTRKTRTDGSNVRKLVTHQLEQYNLPQPSIDGTFEIVPLKSKGVPKILLEFIDTYIVTGGSSYNLQVWNRMPDSNSLLVTLASNESLKCSDVRFVFIKIDVEQKIISSVIILTPNYIVENFGKFGKPTIKHQSLISRKIRNTILESESKIKTYPDSKKASYLITDDFNAPETNMVTEPNIRSLFSIALLRTRVAEKLIGYQLEDASTKNRGQALEKKVLELLGYDTALSPFLYGGFPDIPNQLLEVKVQDSPTIDLGRYSPEKEELIVESLNLTTFDVRYLVAFTNSSGVIEGIVIAPGERLGDLFSYVSSESYKCQRTIPISFFDRYYGQSVFNPS
jgi:hypothetical protein